MTPDSHGGETLEERLDVIERHMELLIEDLERLEQIRKELKHHD